MRLFRKAGRYIKHLTLPTEHNNFRARILHPSGFLYLKLGLIGIQLVLQFMIVAPVPNVLGYAANISTDEVITLTNQKRREHGLPPVQKSDVLSRAAYEKGKHMLEHDYWAHVAPDGTEPWYFFTQAGYRYRFAGENLARDFPDADSAVEAWMASPSHRDNMLSDKYREIGIAVVEGDLSGVDTTIIVQFFGTKYSDLLSVEHLVQAEEASNTAVLATTPQETAPVEATASVQEQPKVLISPFATTKGVSLVVVGLLLMILAVDAYITSRRKIRRIGGRVFAHLTYLGMILIIVLLLKAGEVL